MSQSNVGNSQIYEAGDQRNYKDSEIEEAKRENRFHEGKEHSHKAQDSKDERSFANKVERETKRNEDDDAKLSEEDRLSKIDATAPAKLHGNEPSKGAKLDQELREEEQAELERKGKA